MLKDSYVVNQETFSLAPVCTKYCISKEEKKGIGASVLTPEALQDGFRMPCATALLGVVLPRVAKGPFAAPPLPDARTHTVLIMRYTVDAPITQNLSFLLPFPTCFPAHVCPNLTNCQTISSILWCPLIALPISTHHLTHHNASILVA